MSERVGHDRPGAISQHGLYPVQPVLRAGFHAQGIGFTGSRPRNRECRDISYNDISTFRNEGALHLKSFR